MEDKVLVQFTKELAEAVNTNMTVGRDIKHDFQEHTRMTIKQLWGKYNYLPNKIAKAIEAVAKQTELKCKENG